MSEEISKNTIIILVVLTVIISLLGTWTVLTEVNKVKMDDDGTSSISGQVKLTINPPNEPIATTGRVILEKSK